MIRNKMYFAEYVEPIETEEDEMFWETLRQLYKDRDEIEVNITDPIGVSKVMLIYNIIKEQLRGRDDVSISFNEAPPNGRVIVSGKNILFTNSSWFEKVCQLSCGISVNSTTNHEVVLDIWVDYKTNTEEDDLDGDI